jgi:hypothetical protein
VDVHRGAFDVLGAGDDWGGRAECARCHRTSSFQDGARELMDHAASTGFALEGAHGLAGCEACHLLAAPDGRRLGLARGRSCAACHTDPHVGQFTVEGVTDCARCHADGDTFAASVFVHDRDARFALDERHAALACDACHQPWPLAGGGEAVRYRPLGTECADCHAPEGGGG